MESILGIGPYRIKIDYDKELGIYSGEVVNQPYGVTLTAPTRDKLVLRFERLFVSYIGVWAA
jgi:hypothetical protein